MQAFGRGGNGTFGRGDDARRCHGGVGRGWRCREGQEQAFYNAWTKHDDEEQATKHLYKMIDCTLDQPPGEGQ